MADSRHAQQIKKELIAAGMTTYGLMKFTSRYLPKVIHQDEHIKGVVYGRYNTDTPFGFEGMLIATDRRVIFLDHKPGYTTTDEFTYAVISGVQSSITGIFTSLTLHTKLGDFTIRYANAKCVGIFERYIEQRRLETFDTHSPQETKARGDLPMIQEAALTPEAREFLASHVTGVLSTLDRNGEIQSRPVYYLSESEHIYILTKAGTEKVRNIFANNSVSFVAYDERSYQSIQLRGVAEIEGDHNKKDWVYETLTQLKDNEGKPRLIPITSFHEGAFMVLRITPTDVKFSDFKQKMKNDV